MERCQTCKWWIEPGDDWDEIAYPVDPDTYQRMVMPFEVRLCQHPDKLFCERPVKDIGMALRDGSGYRADLYTAVNFGCVLHERRV